MVNSGASGGRRLAVAVLLTTTPLWAAGCNTMFGLGDLSYEPGSSTTTQSTSSPSGGAGGVGGAAQGGAASGGEGGSSGGGTGQAGAGGGQPGDCKTDADCDDGNSCTDQSCEDGTCIGVSSAVCGLSYASKYVFTPYPTKGGSTGAIAIGPYHPQRELWCILFGRTTNPLNAMESTKISVGGVELSQTSITDPGLDVGSPASYPGWYGRIASYRLPASAQAAAGLNNQSEASFTVDAKDSSDIYGLFVWSYAIATGRSYRGVIGDHESSADNVVSMSISPTMVRSSDVASINASKHASADIVVLALSIATRSTNAPTMTSSSMFGNAALSQHANGSRAALGSAYVHDYVPAGGSETWASLTGSHPGANGIAMHVVTAAYW